MAVTFVLQNQNLSHFWSLSSCCYRY